MTKLSLRCIALSLIVLTPGFAIGADSPFDYSAWNELLNRYVNAESRVDYRGLAAHDKARLDSFLQQFGGKWPSQMTEAEQKAALIDAYNAFTIQWILANYPVESIWRTKHPFTEARNLLDGAKVSLDGIESRLRAMNDPRIHAALVCAARSCPPLRREAYVPSRIDEQLTDNFRKWLANNKLNEFFPQKKVASVSMIFKWYAGDFQKNGGSVEKTISHYAPQGAGAFLLQSGSKLEYQTYRWGLNDVSSLGSNYSQLKFYWDALRNK